MPHARRSNPLGRRARIALFVAAGAAGVAFAAASALPPALGMDEADARENLVSAVGWGNVPVYWAAAAWKRADAGQRVALVQQTVAWARGFVASPAFAAAYAAAREQQKPTPPESQGSVDDELKAQRAERDRQLAAMKASVAQMPASMRKEMEQTVKDTEAMYRQMDQDAEMLALQKQGMQMQREGAAQEHAKALADWQRQWPADGRALVARRLREFLAACQDVDFAAALAPKGADGKRRFADPRFEAKPAEWKLCYRAGKAPVEAARAAATAWLAELPKG